MTSVLHHRPIVESAPALAVADATWHSEDDTAAWSRRLATLPQLANAYITLHGDLGAGKTTLVRHLLRALGVQGRIKSPTYDVVEPHQASLNGAPLAVWHFDFYRFDDPREYEDAGFRDVFASPGLKLAEWPEKAAALLPPADLVLQIEAQADDSRQVALGAGTALGAQLLQELRA